MTIGELTTKFPTAPQMPYIRFIGGAKRPQPTTFFTLMTTTFQTNIADKGYNGWTNYETWNVSLWIQNDPGLYESAKHDCRHYQDLIDLLYGCGSTETPDGVKWNDPKINHIEINEMIADL